MSIKLQEKMENLQQSIAQFKMNRKKALSEGKKSQARRITNKIKKYNLLLEEHSTSNEEEVSNRLRKIQTSTILLLIEVVVNWGKP